MARTPDNVGPRAAGAPPAGPKNGRRQFASKMLIIGIVGLGVLAAGFATLFHYWGTRRTMAFYGAQAAILMSEAPQVEVLELVDANADNAAKVDDAAKLDSAPGDSTTARERLTVAGGTYLISARRQVDKRPGLTNVRRALVIDITYDWTAEPPAASPTWKYALQFSDGARTALVLFDPETHQVAPAGEKNPAHLVAAASQEIAAFCRAAVASKE